jgi:hypothetical protein
MRVPALKIPFMGRTQPAVAVERAQRELGNKNRVSVIYFFSWGGGASASPSPSGSFRLLREPLTGGAAHWRGW